MLYREVTPSNEIAHLILSFWEFAVESETSEPIVHEVFPDGCVSLIYRQNKNLNINTLFIHGLTLETIKTQVFAGDVFWGMRLMPSACAKILRSNPAEIRLQILNDSRNFAHLTDNLPEKFAVCENFEEAIELYETQLRSLKIKPAETDEKVAKVIKIIDENCGEIKIFEIAEAVGLSPRQLERRFKKSAGLTPKLFVRVRRLRATAVNLIENKTSNWANRAAAMGFADQSHLTHEFISVTKRSPNSFAKKVKQIKHGNLIK